MYKDDRQWTKINAMSWCGSKVAVIVPAPPTIEERQTVALDAYLCIIKDDVDIRTGPWHQA
jgi:hypothetical protein